ncbi:hypothetical protein Aperf_G00000105988 [Anoplocephala perfoliata]
MARLPKSIKIVVHDGRNLDYRVAGSKKTPQTRRWRVIFVGGEKKQATAIVDEQDGFPRWDCEVLIAPPKPVDSVQMLVVDGKEREVGQIVIALSELPWPPAPPPSLVTSQLHVRELQPTKHNPTPCGQLSFWIWAVDYWPEGTVPASGHGARHSLKAIGSALKSSQHGSLMGSQSGGGDSRSRIGAKFRDMKGRKYGERSGASYISTSGQNLPQQDEGSVIMGGSILSSHAGLAPTVGGWPSATSELTGGLAEEGNIINGKGSYNPLVSAEQDDQDVFGNGIGRASSLYAKGGTVAGISGNNSSNVEDVWGNASAVISPTSDGAPAIREGRGRRRAMVDHLKSRLSRSSANLSELGHKRRSRHSSPQGSRYEQEGAVPLDEPHTDGAPAPMRPDNRPIVRHSELTLEPNPQNTNKLVKEEWGLPSTAPAESVRRLPPKVPAESSAAYGLHPEEKPGKAKDDMSKRELIDLTNVLEERLLATRTELVRANMEQNQLNARIEDLNAELTQTRTQLSTLRNRLLEDNLTQYLEVDGTKQSSVRSISRPERLTTFQSPNTSPPGATARSPENSFLSKAKAFASKSFGGGVISSSTSQPNLSDAGLNFQNSPPSSPARNGLIDYGSVW